MEIIRQHSGNGGGPYYFEIYYDQESVNSWGETHTYTETLVIVPRGLLTELNQDQCIVPALVVFEGLVFR